jgi:hypothetical protein
MLSIPIDAESQSVGVTFDKDLDGLFATVLLFLLRRNALFVVQSLIRMREM